MRNLAADTRRLREIKRKGFPWYVVESLLFENGYQAVVMYRMASAFKRWRIPLLGPWIARTSLFLTGVDIAPGAVIGPGLLISHGTGLVIGDAARIGAGCTLLHQVTIGAPATERRGEMPTVGDNAYLGAGACLIGGITLGDDVLVGAGTVVTRDVPADSTVTSEAALRIRTRGGDQA